MSRASRALLGLLLGACAAPGRRDSSAVLEVLLAQASAWNRGDLEGYMRGYLESPDLSFFSGGTVTEGYAPVLERYRKRYQSEGREMGALSFEELRVDRLASDAALVRGRFRLKAPDGETTGLFTLLLRKTKGGWRIVHDHTSV
ncbi:MAG: YybH family protein [Planctomycetota bacterium]